MKRIFFALIFAVAVVSPFAARAQFATPPGVAVDSPLGAAIAAPVGGQTFIAPSHSGVINIGQAFGAIAQPYIDGLVNALILAGVSWLGMILRNKFNISIDEGHRDALVTALQNQAGSLIADGFVKIQNAKVTVPSQQLAESANEVLAVIPDAAAHLGLTPEYVAKRIVDMVPQTAAGAAMIAAAQPAAPAAPKA